MFLEPSWYMLVTHCVGGEWGREANIVFDGVFLEPSWYMFSYTLRVRGVGRGRSEWAVERFLNLALIFLIE